MEKDNSLGCDICTDRSRLSLHNGPSSSSSSSSSSRPPPTFRIHSWILSPPACTYSPLLSSSNTLRAIHLLVPTASPELLLIRWKSLSALSLHPISLSPSAICSPFSTLRRLHMFSIRSSTTPGCFQTVSQRLLLIPSSPTTPFTSTSRPRSSPHTSSPLRTCPQRLPRPQLPVPLPHRFRPLVRPSQHASRRGIPLTLSTVASFIPNSGRPGKPWQPWHPPAALWHPPASLWHLLLVSGVPTAYRTSLLGGARFCPY